MKDKFPVKIHILPDDRIIIEDWLNYRFKIFTMNGEYSKSFSTLYDMVVIDADRLAGFYWDTKASKPRAGVYSIDRRKWLWIDKRTAYNFNTSVLEVANKAIYVWNAEEEKGYNYSIEGELLQTYSEQPLALGIKSSRREGPVIKTTLSYSDETYTIFAKEPVEVDYRDENRFLYYIKIFVNASGDRIRQVYRYDICGKEKGMLELPLSMYEPQPGSMGKSIPVAEYGDPVVSHSGDVYTWMRSKKEYKIIKWTWVDKQSDPKGGPDEPQEVQAVPTVSGVFLTWKPAPQDPGCVKGYEIRKASSLDGNYSSGTIVPGNARQSYIFNDSSATSGARWYYRIRSLSDMGNSAHVEVNAAMP
ncbi:MAG: fibronectin type III domain-containing protein [Deltaproteobacteria bacterium]|nr:fibronectin type III domain-containing protein [Deltaproteobacteria bacterium]